MIPSIYSTLSFAANKPNSVRDLYNAHLNAISQTAQKQADIAVATNAPVAPSLSNPIPMQGTGQKLDTIA